MKLKWRNTPRRVAALLFVAALLPRLPGLARFLTSDENTNIFFAGSNVIAAVLQGNLRGTYWHFYPGVTMSWLDALGMGGQYLLDILSGRPVPPFTEYIYGDILSLVVANRLPYALLTAVAVPGLYLLARKLLPERVAVLAALFMAFDPFFLAHSRVAHGDAPVAVFMTFSALAFFIYAAQPARPRPLPAQLLEQAKNPYLVGSAVFGSLAALTKAPGQFMALFITGMALLYAAGEWRQARSRPSGSVAVSGIAARWLAAVILWGVVSLAVFILLWPSMWVDPAGTIRQMWLETFGKVNEGHLVYFLGRPTLNPGPWFYLYVIPFRLTPIVLLGALLSLALVVRPGPVVKTLHPKFNPLFLLWLFTVSLFLFGNLSPKKQDRYLLPLFPFFNLLAAAGWVGAIHLALANFQLRPSTLKPRLVAILVSGLLLLHFIPVVSYYPYYLTYFNPLLGGPARAAQTTLMGWGEGMEQVAAYLNSKPNAAGLYVASTPSQTLLPYFAGTGENFYTNDIAFRADYVVLYLAQMQRMAPSPEIVNYFQAQQPEKVITIKGVPYAKIYRNRKRILPDIPADAIPQNTGLDNIIRLAGYRLQPAQPGSPTLELTLYWHALVRPEANYTVSVRARAADGRLLAQRDSWPVNGLLPTSQWRQGDYVADTHRLLLSPADAGSLHTIELVVYNLDTGQTLGPPITLPANRKE